jgi:hypothetical protein
MLPIYLLKKLKLIEMGKIAHLITAIVTVAIVSMDLGLDYNEAELKLYTNPIIQIIVVLSVAYEILDDFNMSVIVLAMWALVKYSIKLNLYKPKKEKK